MQEYTGSEAEDRTHEETIVMIISSELEKIKKKIEIVIMNTHDKRDKLDAINKINDELLNAVYLAIKTTIETNCFENK